MEPQVFWCSTESLRDMRLFAALLDRQPKERRTKFATIRNRDARNASLAAWSLLEFALNRLEISENERKVCVAAGGKPYLASGAVRFNLSHSGGVALCAIGSMELGVDVQAPGTLRPALVRRCCSEEELSWLSGRPEEVFFRLWARKESLLKAWGCGLACDFRSVACVPGDMVWHAGQRWRFLEAQPGGLPACVCVPADIGRARWIRAEPVELL